MLQNILNKTPVKERRISVQTIKQETVNLTNLSQSISYLNYFAKFNQYSPAKSGVKPQGSIISYAVNTNQGLFRNYNEDRVSIILNVIKPNSRVNEIWPKCSFFGVYDGHGGNKCADFLKDNLHQFIFRESCFPYDPITAIRKGFEEAEKKFIQFVYPLKNGIIQDLDRSGSCALVILILDDVCYVANLGDSRAIYSENNSRSLFCLSKDHKPLDSEEKNRIESNGGFVYQGQLNSQNKPINLQFNHNLSSPFRLFPGRLSVSRSFGDIEAKFPEFGGNPKVLIATPSILSFKLSQSSDFIVFGTDGIFDKLTNSDIIKSVWFCLKDEIYTNDINELSARCVDLILKNSMMNQSTDNVTCIFIAFQGFKDAIQNKSNFEKIERNCENIKESSFELMKDQFNLISDKTRKVELSTGNKVMRCSSLNVVNVELKNKNKSFNGRINESFDQNNFINNRNNSQSYHSRIRISSQNNKVHDKI